MKDDHKLVWLFLNITTIIFAIGLVQLFLDFELDIYVVWMAFAYGTLYYLAKQK